MWKIVLGFAVFAAVALYLLSKGGDVDISGEKHGLVLENMKSKVL
jgi:hypothetical protein